MQNDRDLMAIFEERNAFLKGHFLLSSGSHSPHYFQCALLFQDPALGANLGGMIANLFKDIKIDVVMGPAMGGILLAYEAARALGVRALFAEREDGGWPPEREITDRPGKGTMAIRRGLHLSPGEQVLLVEDVLTTGASIKEIIDLVKQAGAIPIGIGALVDRSGGILIFPCPYKALLQIPVVKYSPEKCPLCQKNIPLLKPGSRRIPIT